ncbi:reverse transcriptase family protein [Mucilaginibacter sp.]|jgi:RNA-directed DNA polymerase|uniref:reverse transcriptase family protein n=1 Tax=Mucilaginibacter sp. TaxID=1882438 RepID=UPI002CFA5B3F|nr:reverse transcriptase family protein [Mucilaginibacter sp.]HTI61114.1 reverse transcriptase family protein [Mucilaginibacter sp.]
MTYDYYEKRFRIKAYEAGYSEDDIQKCLIYAKPLLDKNLPVIYNTANLSALVGYNKSYLKKSALFTNSFYRSFSVRKKNSNKLRYLKEPLPSLKEIQIWILENILYLIPVSKFAKAYVPKRNILENVRFHKNKDKIVSLDIENFFPSIRRTYVENIFKALGYSSNVSNLLSKLCCCDEILPQGAPTSPYLSNLYLREFDDNIAGYCLQKKIRYTRYADDLTFSGTFDENELINFVKNELILIKLNLNKEKTKILKPDQRQIVTGIVVNKIIQIPKDQRKQIRQEIYYLKKYGLTDHLIKTKNFRSNYIGHLIGKINYALYVNPNDNEMKEYKEYLYASYIESPRRSSL